MACIGPLYFGACIGPGANLPYQPIDIAWSVFEKTRRQAINGFHLRPVPYALFGWSGYVYLYGLRHALSV